MYLFLRLSFFSLLKFKSQKVNLSSSACKRLYYYEQCSKTRNAMTYLFSELKEIGEILNSCFM